MRFEIDAAVVRECDGSARDALLLAAIRTLDQGKWIARSLGEWGEATGLSEDQVQRGLQSLARRGAIEVTRSARKREPSVAHLRGGDRIVQHVKRVLAVRPVPTAKKVRIMTRNRGAHACTEPRRVRVRRSVEEPG